MRHRVGGGSLGDRTAGVGRAGEAVSVAAGPAVAERRWQGRGNLAGVLVAAAALTACASVAGTPSAPGISGG